MTCPQHAFALPCPRHSRLPPLRNALKYTYGQLKTKRSCQGPTTVFAVRMQGKTTSVFRRFGWAWCLHPSQSLNSALVGATQHDEVSPSYHSGDIEDKFRELSTFRIIVLQSSLGLSTYNEQGVQNFVICLHRTWMCSGRLFPLSIANFSEQCYPSGLYSGEAILPCVCGTKYIFKHYLHKFQTVVRTDFCRFYMGHSI